MQQTEDLFGDWSYKKEGQEHWLMGPNGRTFKLPRPESDGNKDTVLIHGVCDDKPVITVEVECLRSADHGLDRTNLFWGADEIESWTDAVVVREDGSALVHVRGTGGNETFEIVERNADGNVTVLATIDRSLCSWIGGLREVDGKIEYYHRDYGTWFKLDQKLEPIGSR